MNLIWDLKAIHPHIDCGCVLGKEGNGGGALGLSVTLSGGAGTCADMGRVGTDLPDSDIHSNLDPGTSASLRPAPLAADPPVSEGDTIANFSLFTAATRSRAEQGSQMLMSRFTVA